MAASCEGHAEVVQLLVDAGAEKDLKNEVSGDNCSCWTGVSEFMFNAFPALCLVS